MSTKVNKTSALVTASALAAAVSMASAFSVMADDGAMNGDMKMDMEKCYGVVKAGANDCAGAGHSCAGQASADASSSEFIMLPAGTCAKLAGGDTTSS